MIDRTLQCPFDRWRVKPQCFRILPRILNKYNVNIHYLLNGLKPRSGFRFQKLFFVFELLSNKANAGISGK